MPRVTRASARQAEAGPSTAVESRPTRTFQAAARSVSQATQSEPQAVRTGATAPVDREVEADFLALSTRQQRAVDKAFDRALRQGARKRRRGNDGKPISATTAEAGDSGDQAGGFMTDEDAGGFIADEDIGGGFMSAEDDGGGFMVDDDDEAGDGGFFPPSPAAVSERGKERQRATSTTGGDDIVATSIPLSAIPAILTSLNLPYDDDVLAVFRASATGWSGEEAEAPSESLTVARTDFRAVCAALMEPDAEGDGDIDVVMSDGIDEEDDEDIYEASRASTPLSSLGGASGGEDDFADEAETSRRRKGKGKAKHDLEAPMGIAPKLSRERKDGVKQTWDMFLDISTQPVRGPRAIGKDEVRRWAKELGETYTEDEIADMITLFSTQPEKRALSYDDFSNVLMRGGLV